MCAGRATYQPTSNGGENLACRKKSVDSRQNTAVCSKKKTPEAPRDGSGGRPYAQTAAAPALRSPNRIFLFPVNQNCWAKRALLAVSLASGVLWRLLWRGGNERKAR